MRFTTLPQLSHERVHLRPIEPRDLVPWCAYLSRPEVYTHTSWDVHDPQELAPYVWQPESRTAASLLRLAIARRTDDALIGTAGFHTVSPQNDSAEIAYDLAPEHWGQGIAQRVCAALVQWAHAQAGVVRVQATVLDSNLRSMAVLARCGFAREGLLHAWRMVRGRPGDFFMYAHVRPRPREGGGTQAVAVE